MKDYFVNLPLTYIAKDKAYLEYFFAQGLNPELGMDVLSLQFGPHWHQLTAEKISSAGLRCALHLPFIDLQPGSRDQLILESTRSRLRQAIDIAAIYGPEHLIGHAHFTPVYEDQFPQWLNNSVVTWTQILNSWSGHPPLYLENTCEKDPRLLSDLLVELGGHDVGFCFDVGHWYCFGTGCKEKDLSSWLETLAPFLRHLHLHDNHGEGDEHLGMGEGDIPWSEFFAGLEHLQLSPGVTLEPHCLDDLQCSQRYMRENPIWFSRLGVVSAAD